MNWKLTLGCFFCLGVNSFAFASDDTGAKLEEAKKFQIQEIDQHIASLQEKKSCILAASNHDAMKACREKAKADREKMGAEMKQHRAQKMDERIQRLQEKKQEMQKSGGK